MELANSRHRRDFPRPPGSWRLWRHLWAPAELMWATAAFGGVEKNKKNWGAGGAPVGASA